MGGSAAINLNIFMRISMTWSAQQYLVFEDERSRPVRDLLGAIPASSARRVLDLGCGPGNSTELLAARFPEAAVIGLDNSPDMIAAARKRLPRINFIEHDLQSWDDPGPFDVILSNAVLHWVPDHQTLLPRLVQKLSSGGHLALQLPDNLDEPAHRLMRDVGQEGPWAAKLASAAGARASVGNVDWYYRMLAAHCSRVDIWRTTYYHPLKGGASAVVEWFKGSGLRPFLAPLDPEERSAYLEHYKSALERAYPLLPDGTLLLPFPRLFMVASRP
jgi:trans-aconitate 2-methyltransferase